MPMIPERQQPTERPGSRAKVPDLQQRYGAVGISAVAAAMRFRDEPRPSADDRKTESNFRAT